MFDLSGMTALVTGASGGLGSAIAKALAGQGARLAVSGSNVEKLENFRSSLGGDHVALPCNLSDGAAVDQLVPSAVDALGGKLDILVNNAGVTRDNLLMRMKDEEFEEVIRINLEAAFRLMRAAARPMMKARFGRIISITSVVGAAGSPQRESEQPSAEPSGRAEVEHRPPTPAPTRAPATASRMQRPGSMRA